MEIVVNKITGDDLIDLACSYTSGKISKINKSAIYRAEHSPIRTQMFTVEMKDIPTYASVHFTRHKIGVEHFVKSNRRSTELITRETPVNHLMFINAQALINMSRYRMCHKADSKVVEIMYLIQSMVSQFDQELSVAMVPNCVYRGKCPEMKSCGDFKL